MSHGIVQPFIDYTTGPGGDTGLDDPTAIRPILNGEDVVGADPQVGSGGVVNRPTEHLRRRTETLRDVLEDVLYLQGADRALLLAGPGRVTWPGPTTTGQSGILGLDGPLFLVPALTPGAEQALPIPPVASKFGRLVLEKADGNAGLTVSSLRRSYEGGDRISLAVMPGTSLAVEAQGAPARTVLLTVPPLTTLAQVASLLGGLTADDPPRPLVNVALASGAASNDALLVPQARQYMEGNHDGEAHTLMPSNLATFFTSNPESALAEGDTLCIQYAKMIDETGSLGGRRQSTPENSNTAIPAGSYFNSRMNPEKLTNAIPVCKVVNGRLVFLSGAQVPPGATNADLAGAQGAAVSYAGGPAWFDGTTNPAASVEAQLDKIVTDLTSQVAAASGAHKIAVDPTLYSFGVRAAESLKARIDAIAAAKANLHTGNTFTKPLTINTGNNDNLGSMVQSDEAPTSAYKPVLFLEGVNGGHVWVYQKRESNGIAITSNAHWDPDDNVWRHDNDFLAASYLSIDQDAFSIRTRAQGDAAWADDAWTQVALSYDLTSGVLAVLGGLQGGAVTTAEADVRHGDRTKSLLPCRIEDGWHHQGTSVSAGTTIGAVFWDIDLAVGDRIKLVRVIYNVVGAVIVDPQMNAAWYKQTAVAGPTAPTVANITPFTGMLSGGPTDVMELALVPSAPVVIGAGERHVIHVIPAALTNTTKTIYRVEVVYDRPQ